MSIRRELGFSKGFPFFGCLRLQRAMRILGVTQRVEIGDVLLLFFFYGQTVSF